jgi:hypothetical protein
MNIEEGIIILSVYSKKNQVSHDARFSKNKLLKN